MAGGPSEGGRVSGGFDPESLAALRRLGNPRVFARGQRLVFEGDRRGSVLLVESGSVKIVRTSADGDEVVLAVRGPGQILGDLSVLTESTTSASAVALENGSASVIHAASYLELLEQRPELLRVQVRRLVAALLESDAKLLELATLDVRARVARRLTALVDLTTESTDGGLRLTTSLSQEELAGMCGASREAVARVLRELRDAGIVRTDRRRITIVDLDALRART